MTRLHRSFGSIVLLWSLASAGQCHAQYNYPAGYGGYGWHGWGGGPGGTAAGMGVFAAGAGQAAAGAGERNMENSQARAQNAQTAMGVNNYMYECQQRNNQAYYTKLAQKQQRDVAALNEMQDRILNHPLEEDINSGDTLNAVYLAIIDPQIYFQTLQMAQAPLNSSSVKNIPFNSASQGITYSLEQLTDPDTVPAIFKTPAFASERATIKALAAELRKESLEKEAPQSATIKKFRGALDKAKKTLDAQGQLDEEQKFEADKYLKALYGLTRMIDSPSYDVYLAAVDATPTVPLCEVLTFMHAFNLRFGPAKTPEQRELYAQLYGMMSELRKGIALPGPNTPPAQLANAPAPQPNAPPAATGTERLTNFYGGMSYAHARGPGEATPPPPPAPGQ